LVAFEDIDYTVVDGVGTIVMNRPEVHNAFRLQTLDELREAFLAADCDPDVGVVVLTGAGTKAFSSGGDIRMEDASDGRGAREMGQRCMALSLAIRTSGKPVIARVNGWCVGGGNELNLLCDLTVAAESANFGQAGPRMGSVPVWWGTQLLPRLIGDKRAKEVVFLCQSYTAQQALEMGWINRVVPDEELDKAVAEWCDRLLGMSPQALRVAKLHLNMEADRQWPSVAAGYEYISFIHNTDEFHEGTTAFLEKRPAAFAQFR
jgi:dihydroxynaphthoic acid synthetase